MYTKGEVIWAKIKGFPWWPGIIAQVINDKENSHGITELLVNFVGENSHAQLTLDKVAKYQDKYDEYAKMKKKKLLHSIEIANKIVRGETTFQVEHGKLEDKESFSNKKLPSHNVLVKQRKRVDSKSDEKSLSNGMPYDSDVTSPNDSDMNHLLMSPYDKDAKKPQAHGRKDSRKGSDFIVGRKSSQVEKSPALNKNMKNRGNSKREAEENIDSEEPKLMKAFKLDGNIDELHESKQREDDLTAKTDKTGLKSSPIFNNIDAVFSFNNSEVTESFNAKNSRKNSSALINSNNNSTELIKAKTNDFDILRDLIIEKITNSGSPSVCGTILEKSIGDVISKINPETVSISEIVENDLGRNIYTLIILLDELFSSIPIDAESELYDMKDQLVTFNDIIKSRLVLHFAENADFCSVWLKKLETKREEKAALQALEEVKKPQQPLKVAENIEKKEKTEKITRKVPEGCENTNLRSEKNHMDEEKSATLQINFEEYRFEGEKKKSGLIERIPKMVTTSTKITKPIYNSAIENSKMDTTQKPSVMNPTLRKKICLKMSKILQEKYNLEKNASQEMTLKIETKIRSFNPDMQMEYKNKILIVLKLLKYSLIDIEDFVNNFNTDFYILQQKLEAYTKQNADVHLDTNFGEDSPSLAKEISQDAALISLKLDEFKNGENQEGIAQIA